MISQWQISGMNFSTVSEAEGGGRHGEVCFVLETDTHYKFKESNRPANGRSVLNSRTPNHKWIAVAGKHAPKDIALIVALG
jgi:hypothetical protein